MRYGKVLARARRFVVGGMGGSAYAADLLRGSVRALDLSVHRTYGIPDAVRDDPDSYLAIASSYSGNTEEAIDFARTALGVGVPLAALTTGGALLAFAEAHEIPHVVLPAVGLQPRSALGFSMLGLAALTGSEHLLGELAALEGRLDPTAQEAAGRMLADSLGERIPVIYASEENRALANNWKIRLNETGKIPAYYDVFPELNHNEIEGHSQARHSGRFHFLFLTDALDHPRVARRMELTRSLYETCGRRVTELPLAGERRLERLLGSLVLADWTALYLARARGVDPERVDMIERLKGELG